VQVGIFFTTNHFKNMSFRVLFRHSHRYVDAHFATVFLPLNGGSKLVFGDGSDDPLPACLEAALGQ
jgi:hypothetical protein